MCEAFQLTAAERHDQVALRTISEGMVITFAEYAERVRRLAGGIHALGVGRGDTVGFMLANRPEFHLLDTAVMHLGATPFSIYNTSSAEQIEFLIGDAANRVMIVEAAFLERARGAISKAGGVEHLVVLDAAPEDAITLDELERADPGEGFDFEERWRSVTPDDVLTLIYTSGTTGPPKGVQLTHANEMAECRGIDQVARPNPGGMVISYLPLAHIADRGLSHYGQMAWGYAVTVGAGCP